MLLRYVMHEFRYTFIIDGNVSNAKLTMTARLASYGYCRFSSHYIKDIYVSAINRELQIGPKMMALQIWWKYAFWCFLHPIWRKDYCKLFVSIYSWTLTDLNPMVQSLTRGTRRKDILSQSPLLRWLKILSQPPGTTAPPIRLNSEH